jgi:putative membrane protein
LPDPETPHPPASELFIRDHLAGYRTELANRRTFLAYIRTTLALVAAALVFIKFWQHPAVIILGWALLPISGIILVRGFLIYRRINRVVRREEIKRGKRRTLLMNPSNRGGKGEGR